MGEVMSREGVDRVRAYERTRRRLSGVLFLALLVLAALTSFGPAGWTFWAVIAVVAGMAGLMLFSYLARPQLSSAAAVGAEDDFAAARGRNNLLIVLVIGAGLLHAALRPSDPVGVLWCVAALLVAIQVIGGSALWLNVHGYRFQARDELIEARRATAAKVGYWVLLAGAALVGITVLLAPQFALTSVLALCWAGLAAPILTLTWLDRRSANS